VKFGSLFSGIGGMDLGLERAGMECAWQVELDDYCTKVLNKHWPDVTKHKDVRDVGKHNLETVALVAGGFPCQPHSVAGKRKGADDDRNLWPEFIRIIRALKPRYVLGENVPGIVTTYLDTVLSDLEGEGYSCTTFNIPACGFDAPHRRERVFIVAYTSVSGNRSEVIGKKIERSKAKRSPSRSARSGSGDGKGRDVADANGTRTPQSKRSEPKMRRRPFNSGQDVGNTKKFRRDEGKSKKSREYRKSKGKAGRSGSTLADTKRNKSRGLCVRQISPDAGTEGNGREEASWWSVEPNVGRVAHGIPSRVDRLRGLGNAVVPQVAQYIGERIIEFDKELV
jgi:DNA (cytosine-5)-methyltransferase 1